MVPEWRFELQTCGLRIRCSTVLSYSGKTS
jgi:hypothetical protein